MKSGIRKAFSKKIKNLKNSDQKNAWKLKNACELKNVYK
jgi:hypothetical protein